MNKEVVRSKSNEFFNIIRYILIIRTIPAMETLFKIVGTLLKQVAEIEKNTGLPT